MKPLKIHSFKAAIFFPFRLVYNLDIWWKAVLGLGIVLILAGIQLSIFGKDDKPSAETVAAGGFRGGSQSQTGVCALLFQRGKI